jgi:hypothetical protein
MGHQMSGASIQHQQQNHQQQQHHQQQGLNKDYASDTGSTNARDSLCFGNNNNLLHGVP